MIHSCDLHLHLGPFLGNYDAHLNSEDSHDQDLAMDKVKARGGTMIMWHSSLTPFVTVIPTDSPSFQTILLKMPETVPSLHTAIYLLTAGKDDQFFSTLAELTDHLIQKPPTLSEVMPIQTPTIPTGKISSPISVPTFPSQDYPYTIPPTTTLLVKETLIAR